MKISISGTLFALSSALDYVESEVFGVTTHHSKRVAFLCVLMGRQLGYAPKELTALATAAVMHDNALTEYIALRRSMGNSFPAAQLDARPHCEMGEYNMSRLPFYDEVKGMVLYHHENADGSGPFHKTATETPQAAQLIHFADQLDNTFSFDKVNEEEYAKVLAWLEEKRGSLFDEALPPVFQQAVPYCRLQQMQEGSITALLAEALPQHAPDYDTEAIRAFAALFAKITDYKSPITSEHSIGVAEKSAALGHFYGSDDETCTKLYLAGALHDIGKLTIPNQILDKPDKLTSEEFAIVQMHSLASFNILKNLTNLPDVVSWASLHHEKLNGSGYPFHKKADELGRNERILCCVDIYQALTEPRPYKSGMSHDQTIALMRTMAENGEIDAKIVEDIAFCFGSPDPACRPDRFADRACYA